jgi:hypothetical protein
VVVPVVYTYLDDFSAWLTLRVRRWTTSPEEYAEYVREQRTKSASRPEPEAATDREPAPEPAGAPAPTLAGAPAMPRGSAEDG